MNPLLNSKKFSPLYYKLEQQQRARMADVKVCHPPHIPSDGTYEPDHGIERIINDRFKLKTTKHIEGKDWTQEFAFIRNQI